MTRDSALDQKKVPLSIYTYDLEILRSAPNVTHMAGHLLALEDAAWRLVLSDRTRGTMRQRVAVRRVLHAEIVAFDGAGKALTDRGADDINNLTQTNLSGESTVSPSMR